MMSGQAEEDEIYNKRKMVATTIAAPLASFIAKFVTYPIDTVKSKIQASTAEFHSFKNYKVGHSLQLGRLELTQSGISIELRDCLGSSGESPSLPSGPSSPSPLTSLSMNGSSTDYKRSRYLPG